MIKRHVSAVLTIADGFCGRALASHEAVITLDGATAKPQYRDGGCFVFCDLEDGRHSFIVESPYFLPESIELETSPLTTLNVAVRLKPAEKYRFTVSAAFLELNVRISGKRKAEPLICLAQKNARCELKIASDDVKAGDKRIKSFFKTYPRELLFPCVYLINDGENSEWVTITELAGGDAFLAEGLKKAHKRGKSMFPAQLYSGFGKTLHAVLRFDFGGCDELVCAALGDGFGCKCFDFKLSEGRTSGEIEL